MIDNLRIARESYGRCVLQPTFFEDFYSTFMDSSPDIKRYFENTDLKKQQGLLREGISFMLLYGAGNQAGNMAIEKISGIHDKNHVNVKPEHYPYWTRNLLENIKKHDKQYSDSVENAWQDVIAKGINRFIEDYKNTPKNEQ